MNQKMRICCASLAVLMSFTAITPTVEAFAVEKNQESLVTVQEFSKMSASNAYDWELLKDIFDESLRVDSGIDINRFGDSHVQPNGVKSKAAKIAAKQMIKKLKSIGEKAFNKAIKKLPIPQKIKNYIKYETVMKVLNIVTDFEGDITNALTAGLEQVGIPEWAAGVISRALVTFLL